MNAGRHALLLLLLAGCGGDEPAVEAPPSAADQLVLGQAIAAMQAGRSYEVAGALAQLLARDPPPAMAQMLAGEAAYDLGKYAEAVERLSDAVRRLATYAPNATTLGFAHYKLGQFGEASAVFRSIVAARPDAYKAHYGLGLVALHEGRIEEARSALQEALRLQPAYVKARFAMGQLLQDEGRLDEAAEALQAVLVEVPAHDQALFRLAQVREAQGRTDESAALLARQQQVYATKEELGGLQAAVRSGTDTPATWARIVLLNTRLGDDDEARQALQAGLQRFPEAPDLVALLTSPAPGAER